MVGVDGGSDGEDGREGGRGSFEVLGSDNGGAVCRAGGVGGAIQERFVA